MGPVARGRIAGDPVQSGEHDVIPKDRCRGQTRGWVAGEVLEPIALDGVHRSILVVVLQDSALIPRTRCTAAEALAIDVAGVDYGVVLDRSVLAIAGVDSIQVIVASR